MLFLNKRSVRFCGAVLFRAFAKITALEPLQVFPAMSSPMKLGFGKEGLLDYFLKEVLVIVCGRYPKRPSHWYQPFEHRTRDWDRMSCRSSFPHNPSQSTHYRECGFPWMTSETRLPPEGSSHNWNHHLR